MLVQWLQNTAVGRALFERRRAQRLAAAMGRMERQTPHGRDKLDAAVDLNLPELLARAPKRQAGRDRRAPLDFHGPNDPRGPGWSLLHEAAYRGHWRCAQALLRRGASPRARGPRGLAPLQALFLFDPSRTPNKSDGGCRGPDGLALSERDALLTAQALLRSGAKPAGGELGRAAFLGWSGVCEALLLAGASLRERPDERFESPLIDYCAESFWEGPRSPKTLERLAASAPIPLLLAFLSGSIGTVRALGARLTDAEAARAAALAAGSNRLEMALALLAERPGASAQACLCALARRPGVDDSASVSRFAQWLISRGANPRLGCPDSASPYSAIEEATRAHKSQLVQTLYEAARSEGVSESELAFLTRLVNHHSESKTPLDLAASRQNALRACVEGFHIEASLQSSSSAPSERSSVSGRRRL